MVKLNKVYPRTGDDGTTGLVDGSRVAKHDPRMAAIGDVDEANSAIGVAIAATGGAYPAPLLETVQNDLFDLGADLATPGDDFEPGEMTLRIVPAQVARLEAAIDAANDSLDRKSTRLNSSHVVISYAVFCLKKKKHTPS